MTVAGLGSVPLGVVVPVVVCIGVLRRPVRLVTSGRGLAWRPVVVVCSVAGLGGGAAGRGVKRVVLCGAQGTWGAVGVHRCARCVRCACAMGGNVPLLPPLIFVFFFD